MRDIPRRYGGNQGFLPTEGCREDPISLMELRAFGQPLEDRELLSDRRSSATKAARPARIPRRNTDSAWRKPIPCPVARDALSGYLFRDEERDSLHENYSEVLGRDTVRRGCFLGKNLGLSEVSAGWFVQCNEPGRDSPWREDASFRLREMEFT